MKNKPIRDNPIPRRYTITILRIRKNRPPRAVKSWKVDGAKFADDERDFFLARGYAVNVVEDTSAEAQIGSAS